MRYRLLALPTIVLAALAIASPAQAASCGSVEIDTGGTTGEEGAYGIRASGVSCGKARRLVRFYVRTGDVPVGWGLIKHRGGVRTLEKTFSRGKIRFRLAS